MSHISDNFLTMFIQIANKIDKLENELSFMKDDMRSMIAKLYDLKDEE